MAAFNFSRREVARAFGAALRATRQARGISQDRLSEICEMDRTYPSLVERGLRTPRLFTILILEQALNIEPGWLVTQTLRRMRGES